MPTGEEDGPSKDSSQPKERRRTPPPVGSRTPPPRTRTRTRTDAETDVEHRSVKPERPRGSLFGRVLGRQGLDNALDARFKPYGFESTRPMLRWLILGLLVFVAAGTYATITDSEFRSQIDEWRSEDISEIPIDRDDWAQGSLIAEIEFSNPDELVCNEDELASGSALAQGCRSIDAIFDYAALERINCSTIEGLSSVVTEERPDDPDCLRVEQISVRYEEITNRSNILSILIVALLVILSFPFGSFTHRSSRNLRTMKSEGQKHTPDGTVIRFFVPIVNLYKPFFMFAELFKGSDPNVSGEDSTAWQKKGTYSPIVIIWALAWMAGVIFNPFTVTRFIYTGRSNLDDISKMTGGLIIADILIIVLGILAIIMVYMLSSRQDARAAKIGTVMVTPKPRRDALEKALEEGAEIENKRMGGGKGRDSKRRKK